MMSSDGEKKSDIRLSEFENEFERNHPDFMHKLAAKYSLTSTELVICAMIRSGMKSKAIANLLNTATSTVGTHRTNIRNKMKLKKMGLRTFFLSNF